MDSENEFEIELEKILIWMEYLRLMDDKVIRGRALDVLEKVLVLRY